MTSPFVRVAANVAPALRLRPLRPSRLAAIMSTVMYVKPGCPYCASARDELTERGEAFEERDATANPEWRAELMGYTKNVGMVPTIVRDDGVQVGFPPGRG
jgi:glutaredoxin